MAQSNIIPLKVPQARQSLPKRLAAHAALFAHERRGEEDVFWLKENAEFLNILECTGQPGSDVLSAYEPFYDSLETRLGNYPQYYRFLLSICLDLEDLGMSQDKGTALCSWVHAQGLAQAELSDLQRAEAFRLLARRGIGAEDAGLKDRLHAFINRSATFAIPNKKAAYELTHIVFYLSEYGRKDPDISAQAHQSLTYAGLLAYLDQNYDLLAEICVAIRFAGRTPSSTWEGAVVAAWKATVATPVDDVSGFDDYHAYLVSSWLAAMAGQDPMPLCLEVGCARLDMAQPPARPLRDMSEALSEARNASWSMVRPRILARLSPDGEALLDAAERSSSEFDAFYEGFARASHPGVR
jgi:hypothetical protein